MSVSVIRSGVNRLLTRSPEHEQTASPSGEWIGQAVPAADRPQ